MSTRSEASIFHDLLHLCHPKLFIFRLTLHTRLHTCLYWRFISNFPSPPPGHLFFFSKILFCQIPSFFRMKSDKKFMGIIVNPGIYAFRLEMSSLLYLCSNVSISFFQGFSEGLDSQIRRASASFIQALP